MAASVHFVAELSHVLEVSLLGTADLGYWRDRLGEMGLAPAESEGRAQVLIIAASARFRGIAFRELSISVMVAGSADRAAADASALIQAYNSNRLFAFCERVFFSTPYAHGDVRVSATAAASIALAGRAGPVFRAEMGASGSSSRREPSSRGEDGWEGPVFLPAGRRGGRGPGAVFFARIRGDTRTYPFLDGIDSLTIGPSSGFAPLGAFVDSHFVARQWIIRDDATHAKSKTYNAARAAAIRRNTSPQSPGED